MGRGPLVLISGRDPLDGIGGHETYVRAHALAAASCGFEPHIFCMSKSIRGRTARTDFGVVHYVSHPLPRQRPIAAHGPFLARAVVRFLAQSPGPHPIHSFALWSGAGVAASRALARRGIRAVPLASAYGTRAYEVGAMQGALQAHHGLVHRLRYRGRLRWIQAVDDRVEGWGYAQSRLVLVNYESVRKILVDAYGSALQIRRVPYASPDAFLTAQAPPKASVPGPVARLPSRDAPLILAVSRHDPRKGLDVLLLALADLAAAGVAFRACLVGPGKLLAVHRRLAADLGLGEKVVITGAVEEVRPYFSCADIFVLPSIAEASGSVSILEALRAGTAVIASACDGIPEDLVDGVEALLVAPGDQRALTNALRALLTDPSRRAELAVRAREAHDQKFSAGPFVAALQDLYTELGLPPTTADPRLARTASAT
jgi:glycosyltransferase involved in cell wall biosynthesis